MAKSLDNVMDDLITVFHSYSGKEGDKFKLNKAEMKKLLQEQLPELLLGENESEEANKIFTDLDEDKDGEVDFKEFVVLVASLTATYHEFFKIIETME